MTSAILFHNYYGEHTRWLHFFEKNAKESELYFSYVAGSFYNQDETYEKESLNNLEIDNKISLQPIVRSVTNKGKDIGGKLVLLDAYLHTGANLELLLLLHDKRSPYHSNSEQWNQQLFKIVSSQAQPTIVNMFASDPRLGIVAAKHTIRNENENLEQRNAYTSSDFIKVLRSKYGIHPPDFTYVAGTMFWVRASIYQKFFSTHQPLEIRSTLESGSITDVQGPTHTHAWERMLSWIVTSQGYKMKAI